MKLYYFVFLLSLNIYSAEHALRPVVIHITEEQKDQPPIKRVDSDDIEDPKCCNSSNKVKLALIGLGASTITAITTLVIHLVRCDKN